MNLQDKVAIVTGASGGIGSAVVQRLAEAGARVILGYNNNAAEAEKIAASLPGSGHKAMRIQVLDSASLKELAATVERDFGRCDVLVNSAGFTKMVPHHDLDALTDDLIDSIFAANVRGPFAMVRAFAPLMKKSGDAVIVNISSVAAISGSGSNIAYGGSKAAMDTMSISLARVLGPEIRVMTVSPAAVDTPFVPGRTTAMVEKVAASTPLSRATISASMAAEG